MPAKKESKLGPYLDALKAWLPSVRIRTAEWAEACRAEPALIWQTPAVRYATYVTLALLALWLLRVIIGAATPREVIERAETADFHVVCTNPDCGHHFVINRKFRFKSFPVVCPKCSQQKGVQAVRCVGGPRDGAWVAAERNERGELVGPDCAVPVESATD